MVLEKCFEKRSKIQMYQKQFEISRAFLKVEICGWEPVADFVYTLEKIRQVTESRKIFKLTKCF